MGRASGCRHVLAPRCARSAGWDASRVGDARVTRRIARVQRSARLGQTGESGSAPAGAWALSHGREPVEPKRHEYMSPGGATDRRREPSVAATSLSPLRGSLAIGSHRDHGLTPVAIHERHISVKGPQTGPRAERSLQRAQRSERASTV